MLRNGGREKFRLCDQKRNVRSNHVMDFPGALGFFVL